MGRAYQVRKASMEKTSAAKSKLYAKFGKEILMAAKSGVPDPEMNLSLKRVIEKAKVNQVPSDIINRAIERATSRDIENYVENTYDGFGPGESTFIIECLTDNVNRAAANIKACVNKCHSKLGVSGSVSFAYKNVSVVTLTGASEEEVLEALFNKDVSFDDIETDDEFVTVYGPTTSLYEIKGALEESFGDKIKIEEYEITWIPLELVELNAEDKEVFERLLKMLEELDDVENVYHNVKL